MRKILLAILSLVIVSIATTGSLTSCNNETKHTDTLDTTVIAPIARIDSASADTAAQGSSDDVKRVTGKVVDGAMNSVFIEVAPDSSVEFSYSQLDRNNSEVFYNWSIDDKITVEYVETTRNGEQVDSVVSIQKAE